MKLLALDLSTAACSVALADSDVIQATFALTPRQHNQRILPMIDQLLKSTQLSLNELDALIVADGPGSFTGVRMATGIAQTLAFSAQIPIVTVSTLQAMAQTAYRQFFQNAIFVGNDAHMGEMYVGGYLLNSQGIMDVFYQDALVSPAQITAPIDNVWFGVGSAWGLYRAELVQAFGDRLIGIEATCYPHAQDVLILGRHKLSQGDYTHITEASPNYLRQATAWKCLSQQKSQGNKKPHKK